MKRKFTSIFTALFTFMTTVMAQTAGITLSTNGELRFFAADNIADAIEAAQPNDTIYLSVGNYKMDKLPDPIIDGEVKNGSCITKPLVFIGAGAEYTNLINLKNNNLYIQIGEFENCNLSFEGIGIDYRDIHGRGVAIYNYSDLDKLEFKDSKIFNFYNYNIIDELNVFRCSIHRTFDFGESLVNRLNALKSYFYCLEQGATNEYRDDIVKGYCTSGESGATFVNCIVGVSGDFLIGYFLNSFIFDARSGNASSTFENCYFCYLPETSTVIAGNDIETESDFWGAAHSPEIALEFGCLGNDGAVAGIYGGTGLKYSLYPAYPTADSENSSLEYDKENKKLHVKVSLFDI